MAKRWSARGQHIYLTWVRLDKVKVYVYQRTKIVFSILSVDIAVNDFVWKVSFNLSVPVNTIDAETESYLSNSHPIIDSWWSGLASKSI